MARYVRMEGIIYCTVCGGEHEVFDPTDEGGEYAYLECSPEYWRSMYWRTHKDDYEARPSTKEQKRSRTK